jgi:hypothetical protein
MTSSLEELDLRIRKWRTQTLREATIEPNSGAIESIRQSSTIESEE